VCIGTTRCFLRSGNSRELPVDRTFAPTSALVFLPREKVEEICTAGSGPSLILLGLAAGRAVQSELRRSPRSGRDLLEQQVRHRREGQPHVCASPGLSEGVRVQWQQQPLELDHDGMVDENHPRWHSTRRCGRGGTRCPLPSFGVLHHWACHLGSHLFSQRIPSCLPHTARPLLASLSCHLRTRHSLSCPDS
jgi:hypothetical protein